MINALDLDHAATRFLDLMFEPADCDAIFVCGRFEIQAVPALATDDVAFAGCGHGARRAFLSLDSCS